MFIFWWKMGVKIRTRDSSHRKRIPPFFSFFLPEKNNNHEHDILTMHNIKRCNYNEHWVLYLNWEKAQTKNWQTTSLLSRVHSIWGVHRVHSDFFFFFFLSSNAIFSSMSCLLTHNWTNYRKTTLSNIYWAWEILYIFIVLILALPASDIRIWREKETKE